MISQAGLERLRQEQWDKYATEAQHLLVPGEQLVGVTLVRPHADLKKPPKQYLERSESRGWGALGFAVDFAASLVTGAAASSTVSSGTQKGLLEGGWESQAGRLIINAWNLPAGYWQALRLRAVITDRRAVVCAEPRPGQHEGEPLPVVGEFGRGASGAHAQFRKNGKRVDFAFGDGSWFSLKDDEPTNTLFAQLVGEG